MPRPRGLELPQRPSPRGPPNHVRTSSSDSDPPHHRSPKLADRRSPKGGQSELVNQKKLGPRIADLESQLGQAQEELKKLKTQLASAEAAKKEAQHELENKTKKSVDLEPAADEHSISKGKEHPKTDSTLRDGTVENNQLETDVFEVPVQRTITEPNIEVSEQIEHEEKRVKPVVVSTEISAVLEPQLCHSDDLVMKSDEIKVLKAKLEEKEKEAKAFKQENEVLKKQLDETTLVISTAKSKDEEMTSKLSQLGGELEVSKVNITELKQQLVEAEAAKEALEAEMKKLRVQTEQWRKAADAAAAVLAGGAEMNGRISERCSSMDKHFGGVFEPLASGYNGFWGSPGMADDFDDGLGSGKRKGSGIKKFGDLWKRKGQK